nr:MAG TPA: hypothetical protein [Caudoviricetes sp.]
MVMFSSCRRNAYPPTIISAASAIVLFLLQS